MHTLYMIYDDDGKVTDFVIDNVSASQNFISLDRGPMSYIQSVIDNLNGYIKKNGSLTVENDYLGHVRHGQFDETYGEIQDKRTEDSNHVSHENTQTPAQPAPQPVEPSEPAKSSEGAQPAPASSTASSTASSAASSAPASSK